MASRGYFYKIASKDSQKNKIIEEKNQEMNTTDEARKGRSGSEEGSSKRNFSDGLDQKPQELNPLVSRAPRCLGTKKEHKPRLLSPDCFLVWGMGLPHEGVGAKQFGMSLEAREIKLFGVIFLGFCWDIPPVPKSLRKQSLCSIFSPLDSRAKKAHKHKEKPQESPR